MMPVIMGTSAPRHAAYIATIISYVTVPVRRDRLIRVHGSLACPRTALKFEQGGMHTLKAAKLLSTGILHIREDAHVLVTTILRVNDNPNI